jgi:hypothetical protein
LQFDPFFGPDNSGFRLNRHQLTILKRLCATYGNTISGLECATYGNMIPIGFGNLD